MFQGRAQMTHLRIAKDIHNPHLAYRPDIDGLRALAIISVVIFHAFPSRLPGGFIGVDIFFVISGYLITGIILKAQSGDGFSLLEFYSRRIKRIFPALIVALTFCLVAGWYILLAGEYKALGKHVAAGAGYVSNLVLMFEAGYFDIASELKPLLHLWSLGIEEQFYLFWPLLLILALRVNFNPLVLITLLLTSSLLLNVANITQKPTEVFYSPMFRSWELLVGAFLAYINLHARHEFELVAKRFLLRNPLDNGNKLANILAWSGFAAILLALFVLNRERSFPGWWALLPTAGAVCLIAAGNQAWLNQHILSHKAAVYIGLISYPLYLWHWPLLSFARILKTGSPSFLQRLGIVILSGLCAWATYWLVEKRLRFRQHWGIAAGLFVTLVLLGVAGFQVYRQAGYPDRDPQAEIMARNVGASAWEDQGLNRQPDCAEKFGKDMQYCEIYNIGKPPTVLLIGDSNANHFYPGLAITYAKTNDNLLNLGQGGCPPLFGLNVTMQEGDLHCENSRDKALNYAIETSSINTVVLSMLGVGYATGKREINGNEQSFIRISYRDNQTLTEPLAILESAMRETLTQLVRAGKHVVFITSIPMLDFDPATCVRFRPWQNMTAPLRTPCAMPQKKVTKISGEYRSMVMRVLHDTPQVKIWDTARELCDGENCWAMIGGELLYRDSVHLSLEGSILMGKRLPMQDLQDETQGR